MVICKNSQITGLFSVIFSIVLGDWITHKLMHQKLIVYNKYLFVSLLRLILQKLYIFWDGLETNITLNNNSGWSTAREVWYFTFVAESRINKTAYMTVLYIDYFSIKTAPYLDFFWSESQTKTTLELQILLNSWSTAAVTLFSLSN